MGLTKEAAVKPVAISEIFSSLQGEGPHMGEPHLFVRFQDCHIHCAYCDELDKPGRLMELEDVVQTVKRLDVDEGPHRFVSYTGGEPLMYVSFLKPLLTQLRSESYRAYLETNGILVQALERVIDQVDVVAMDIKLKSVTRETRNYFEEHRAFLRLSRRAPEVFVKMVVSPEVSEDEFLMGVRIMECEDPAIPLILQGVTSEAIDAERQSLILRELQKQALRYLADVRVMPRLHVAMGIR